jgi:hypothetical protein
MIHLHFFLAYGTHQISNICEQFYSLKPLTPPLTSNIKSIPPDKDHFVMKHTKLNASTTKKLFGNPAFNLMHLAFSNKVLFILSATWF